MEVALILGVNGQDGILLSRLLITKGFKVIGVGTQPIPSPNIPKTVVYQKLDIRDTDGVTKLISFYSVDYVYNLASFSSVAESFQDPAKTLEINHIAVKNLLYAIYGNSKNEAVRFYQASSSEMFGAAKQTPQDELTEFNPVSPYGESKVKAHIETEAFRKAGYFVSCGILFNHESEYRPEKFISRKVTTSVARIYKGYQDKLVVGNLDASRDWGAAADYVEAMLRILSHSKADVFVVATGKLHSVRQMISIALAEIGMLDRFDELVSTSSNFLRPADIMVILGNPNKIQNELGWYPKIDFKSLISGMLRFDLEQIES